MDKLIPGLVLAALSGLTFVAYKHPAAYVYFQIPLIVTIVLVFLGIALWEHGANTAYVRLMGFLKPDAWKESQAAFKKLRILNGWMYLGYFGVILYLSFLSVLPRLLG